MPDSGEFLTQVSDYMLNAKKIELQDLKTLSYNLRFHRKAQQILFALSLFDGICASLSKSLEEMNTPLHCSHAHPSLVRVLVTLKTHSIPRGETLEGGDRTSQQHATTYWYCCECDSGGFSIALVNCCADCGHQFCSNCKQE